SLTIFVEPERLVFTFAWENKEGKPGHEKVVTVSFAEYGAKIKLTLHQASFETVTARDLHHSGWQAHWIAWPTIWRRAESANQPIERGRGMQRPAESQAKRLRARGKRL